MKKSLPAALLFAAVITVGAVLAVARTTHNPATQGSVLPVETAPSKSAQFKGRTPIEDQGTQRRSLFEICQHQDPTTPAVRLGASGCFALPY
jgi:hypothetical protein